MSGRVHARHCGIFFYLLTVSSSSLDEEPIEKTVLDLGSKGKMLKEKEMRRLGRGRPFAGGQKKIKAGVTIK